MKIKDIIEHAKKTPNSYNGQAVIAFESGKDYYPPCFEYGLGVGNYVSDLVSKNGSLYYVKRLSGYKIKLIKIVNKTCSNGVE